MKSMISRWPVVWLLTLALMNSAAFAAPSAGSKEDSESGLPSPKQVAEQARAVFDDLAGNSDPAVRGVVLDGRLAMGKNDRVVALDQGLQDGVASIRNVALEQSLAGSNRKLAARAKALLAKLLVSTLAPDRVYASGVVNKELKRKEALKLYKKAAVAGGPEARTDARAQLIAMGGKVAWKVIKAGLAEPDNSVERKQAVAALTTFSDAVAEKWGLAHLHDRDDVGDLARDLLVRLKGRKVERRVDKQLRKIYERSVFAPRVDAAAVLARRGHAAKVRKTLHAAVKFKDPDVQRIGWTGMKHVRHLPTLVKLRGQLTTKERDAWAEPAYAWLRSWAESNGEPKVIELLQEVARSDRRSLSQRALSALAHIKHRPSAPIFESAMTEGQAEVRLAGAKGLRAVAQSQDIERIANLLTREPNLEVKRTLIEALTQIGTPEILKPLQFVITAKQPEIKRAAVDALASTGKPRAIVLIGLVKRDINLDVRFAAWHHLLRLAPETTGAEFSSALSWLSPAQVETLAKDEKIDGAVLHLIAEKGKEALRPAAVEGLRGRGEAAATRLLSLAERGPSPETSASALRALADVRKEKSVATYRAAAAREEPLVRAAAYLAMGLYGPPALLEVVLPGLSDKDPLVRARAAEAAVRLSKREA